MCGRYALNSTPQKLKQRFGAEPPPDLRPRYNVAPTQEVPIVRREGEDRRFALVRWGLVPSWAKDAKFGGYSTINARAETVANKPAYRSAFRHRRALIPADAYYEWQAEAHAKLKQPWAIALKDKEPMGFAGLWERWTSPEDEELESCCIIVTDANELTRSIHDRMPVILDPADWDEWLDPETKNLTGLQALLKPFPPEAMTAWPVGRQVNNPRHDAPDCLEPVAS